MASPTDSLEGLTRGRRLVRNVGWNLAGQMAPMLLAVAAVPWLVRGLGTARFGVLALAWSLVGYFGLFDLSVGRALTKLAAEKLGAGRPEELPGLFWTSFWLTTGLGAAAGAGLAALSPWLAGRALNLPAELRQETQAGLLVLAACMPLVISTTGLRGFLEAHQRFALTSTLRVPAMMLTLAGPLAVLPFSNRLPAVLAALAAARAAHWTALLAACLATVPSLRRGARPARVLVPSLLRLGGWMALGNLAGAVTMYLDRFVIAAVVSASAVAYYAVPFDVMTKLLVLSSGAAAVLFPAFSASCAQDPARARRLYHRGLGCFALVFAPAAALAAAVARPGLALWLGAEFASESYRVAQWLAAGVLGLAMAALPFNLLQAAGRADIPAKLVLAELPVYLAALAWCATRYGVAGAAAAWSLRAVLDAALTLWFAGRLLRAPAQPVLAPGRLMEPAP